MEIDMTVPQFEGPSKLVIQGVDDPYVADLLQVADSRIAELELQLRNAGDEKEIVERKIKNFRQQVRFQSSFSFVCSLYIFVLKMFFSSPSSFRCPSKNYSFKQFYSKTTELISTRFGRNYL